MTWWFLKYLIETLELRGRVHMWTAGANAVDIDFIFLVRSLSLRLGLVDSAALGCPPSPRDSYSAFVVLGLQTLQAAFIFFKHRC